MNLLRDKAWSPYLAGVVIGLLQIPAFLLVDTALGASSSFVTVAGWFGSLADPAIGDHAYFAKYMTTPKYFWQLALVVGIALGALLSVRLSGTRRPAMSGLWRRVADVKGLGPRLLMGFAGGFILLFGARLAGGCTSGHGLSGLSQLALSSTFVTAGIFAGGIAFSMLAYRRM